MTIQNSAQKSARADAGRGGQDHKQANKQHYTAVGIGGGQGLNPAPTSAGGAVISTSRTVQQALAIATTRLNDAIHDHVVALAARHGSTTAPGVRYVHFANATAKAIDQPQSNAKVIAALPIAEQALLALLRRGIAARIPQWAAQVETEGGAKPHNRILTLAKAWAELEVKALKACGVEAIISQAEALLALEVDHG